LRNRGFILISTLLAVFLVASLLALVGSQTLAGWRQTVAAEGQLRSFLMAENGIIAARQALQLQSIDELLQGPDRRFDLEDRTQNGTEWRNPVTFSEARRLDLSTWVPQSDDGILYDSDSRPGFQTASGGFLVRFSNNPEESARSDQDRVVIARSMGIVPVLTPGTWFPELRNHVYLVEAKFRKEQVFMPPSPLVFYGRNGDFNWEGSEFRVDGGGVAAVTVITGSESSLATSLADSIQTSQLNCFEGQGDPPYIMDRSGDYRSHPDLSRIFTGRFWKQFRDNLPRFSDDHCSTNLGIHFLEGGSRIDEPCSGVIVVSGDVQIQGEALIQGIVIHLGDGRLEIRERALVEGGIWVTAARASDEDLVLEDLAFTLADQAQIRFDPVQIAGASACFPITLLDWRILFP